MPRAVKRERAPKGGWIAPGPHEMSWEEHLKLFPDPKPKRKRRKRKEEKA